MNGSAAVLQGGVGSSDDASASVLWAHRDLVLEIAARHAPPGTDPSALVGAGIEGLWDALSRFDASCGHFADFAAWWVRRRVLARVARNG